MLARINEARTRLPDASTPVAERRAVIHRGMDQRAAAVVRPAPQVVCTDYLVRVDGGDITVRGYQPDLPGRLACHVYVHGGGWWLGELHHRDAVCAHLATSVGCVVVSVAHRLAPEHRFPTQVNDCYTALQWVVDHADRLGIDVSRLSIGATLPVPTWRRRQPSWPVTKPGRHCLSRSWRSRALDLTMSQPSVNEVGQDGVLIRDDLAHDIGQYCDPRERGHPYASPLLADDLTGLPPALIMTAEYDILRDDGEAYGRRLIQAGGSADVNRWTGHVHGSHEMTTVLESASEWQSAVATFLRDRLNR